MNRWKQWAGQLAARHGRRETRRPAQAMTLAHRMLASSVHLRIAAPRLHFHFRVYGGVVLRPPVAVPLLEQSGVFGTQGVAGSELRFVHAASGHMRGAVTGPSSVSQVTLQAPQFVPRPPAIARVPMERRFERLHELVRTWSQKSETAIAAASLPALLRQRGVRHEPPVAEAVRVFPAPARVRTEPDESLAASTPVAPKRALPPEISPSNGRGIDVAALTSQVIQQLDRRLIAYQERMGRV